MISENVQPQGNLEIVVEYRDGTTVSSIFKNTILLSGRRALAQCLANAIGDSFQFFITRMIFGDDGTVDGVKKFVNSNREGLFGVTRISKPALANLDTDLPTQVIFTSVIRFDEGIGLTLNEMALQMANGELYSMITFPDLNKTEEMQITFNWHLSFI